MPRAMYNNYYTLNPKLYVIYGNIILYCHSHNIIIDCIYS